MTQTLLATAMFSAIVLSLVLLILAARRAVHPPRVAR